MKEQLVTMALDEMESISMVDIDDDPQLAKRFNDLVPVLFINDIEICRYKLNKKRLLRFLQDKQ